MAKTKGKGNKPLEPENKLQEYMDKEGWSTADLARRSGVSSKTIGKMLAREKTNRLSKIKVAKPFALEAREIFPNDPEL